MRIYGYGYGYGYGYMIQMEISINSAERCSNDSGQAKLAKRAFGAVVNKGQRGRATTFVLPS